LRSRSPLALAPRPEGPDRIVYFNTWYRGHNNARYAELLPRLRRVDPYLLTFPRQRALRAATTVAWRRGRRWLEPALLRAASSRYRYALVTEPAQLPHLSIPAVVDVDDSYWERDAPLLELPQVRAFVVTAESALARFRELGVSKPGYVIPQGVALEEAPSERPPHPPTVGYLAAFLLLPGDRGGDDPLYDLSHLLELWEQVRAGLPEARLLLIGEPSKRVRRRLAGRGDIVLRGRVPQERLVSELAQVDVAVYPRTSGRGIRASKVAVYLGAGVPTVSYDYAVVDDLRETGAGVLVSSPSEFADAVARLLTDDAERARLAERARAAGRERDWRVLAERFERILDEHLPAGGGA
jgi:glycosyltransferase involved in cell wall biosynthesis